MPELAFGKFNGRWGWRVQWTENGKPQTKCFYQEEGKPGKDKADAFQFADEIRNKLNAA